MLPFIISKFTNGFKEIFNRKENKMFKRTVITAILIGLIFSTNYTEQEKRDLGKEAMIKMAAEIFKEAMKVKRNFQSNQLREELIENLSSTAPREEFIVNADLSSELAESNPSATIFVSTDGQQSWINSEKISSV